LTRRALIIIENQPYPADRRVNMEAEALRDAGYAVTVVSPNSSRAPELDATVDGVRVFRFPSPPNGDGVTGFAREYAAATLRIAAILRRLHREDRFDVVMACNPPDFLIHLLRPFARRGAALIFDYHDPAPELFEAMYGRRGPLHRVLLGLERSAFRTADVVLTVNEPCAELVRRRGPVDASRVHVVRNCPDPARVYPVEARPELRRGRAHLVLWIGMMARKESLHLLIAAADDLVRSAGRDDVAFAIVGPAGAGVREELAAEIRRRGLQDTVHLEGEVDIAGLRDYIATADVCVSVDPRNELNDRSTMIKVLEYMIMGKAVVQFPLLEMRQICGDSTAYARDGDALHVAETIGELLDDPARRAELGRRAADRARGGLTWPHQIPSLLRAFDQAASLRAGRRRRPGRSPRWTTARRGEERAARG
jgi:glycosyltransferase involved in cell wall biosynthesis